MPPMRRPQMPKDTAQATPRGLAAERPDEGANEDESHAVNDHQFKPPDDTLSAIIENPDVARLLADMLEMDDVINVRAANDTSRPCTTRGPAAPTTCARRAPRRAQRDERPSPAAAAGATRPAPATPPRGADGARRDADEEQKKGEKRDAPTRNASRLPQPRPRPPPRAQGSGRLHWAP